MFSTNRKEKDDHLKLVLVIRIVHQSMTHLNSGKLWMHCIMQTERLGIFTKFQECIIIIFFLPQNQRSENKMISN